MSAKPLDGRKVSDSILADCARRVQALREGGGLVPCLATILVGEDPASATYVRMKGRRCESVGMQSRRIELPETTTTEALLEQIDTLNRDRAVHGILLQHPVPEGVDERAAFERIDPNKDVDGVTMASFASMAFGLPGFASCTPGGIMRLLAAYDVDVAGMNATVVGRSPILGKPMAMLLLAADATPTVCHSKTADVAADVSRADLVVAAVGRPGFVRGDWIRPGAIVVDAGYNPGNVGDVEQEAAAERASMITPVPGGVGPMTIATLIEQTVTSAERQGEG